jgi:hypothetical protein
MPKKYIVRLTQEEHHHLHKTIKKLSGSSRKVRRAHILLKADANGPCRKDSRTAEAFNCRTKTVENIRQNFVLHGFQQALDGKNVRPRLLRNY